jgi:hypothetical protein
MRRKALHFRMLSFGVVPVRGYDSRFSFLVIEPFDAFDLCHAKCQHNDSSMNQIKAVHLSKCFLNLCHTFSMTSRHYFDIYYQKRK